MATLGSTSKPTYGQQWSGVNTLTQIAARYTMPQKGRLTHVGVWAAGKSASVTAYLCVWNSSGTLVAQSSSFTMASRSFGLSQSDHYYRALTSEYEADAGEVLYVGFSRNPSGAAQWGHNSSGSHYRHSNTGSYPASASFSSGTGSMGAYATYDTNEVPNAPTIVSPKGGTILTDTTPNLVFDHSDPDGDPISSYDLQVDNNSDFSSPLWNISNQTSGISGKRVTRTYAGTGLSRGTTYYWRARTADAEGDGAWSSSGTFRINQLPSATHVSPAASGLAYIWNLASDTQVWDTTSFYAKPRLDWSFSDADGDSQSKFRVKVYSASSGGSTLYDSGQVSSSSTVHNVTWAGDYDTAYWWTVEVWDSRGESSGESSRTAFKMLWSQAIYEYAVPSGATSSSWKFTKATSGTGQTAFLFATATGASGTGRSAWNTSIGALDPDAYLNVLVRLAATTSGSAPSVADMTFTYTASGVHPDKWTISNWISDAFLDPDVRRYGSKALKVVHTQMSNPSEVYIWCDKFHPEPNTEYTLSFWVKTEAPLSSNGVSAYVDIGSNGTSDTQTELVTDTSAEPDGWYRVVHTFTTPADVPDADVTFKLELDDFDAVWLDAVQLELGPVASPWRPGMVSDASILDVSGVQIDAYNGGLFRLRAPDGTSWIELAESGLRIHATGDLSASGTTHGLQIGDTDGTNLAMDNNEIMARFNGAPSTLYLNNEGGTVLVGSSAELQRVGEGWTGFTYQNGWSNYNTSFSPGQYRKDAQGYVHLRGLVKGGTAPSVVITNLPAGYRPSHTVLYGSIASGNIMARIDVSSSGNVTISVGSTAWTSLEGLSFKAEN